ncbi:TetR/AcrR family transcriptional regulator [Neobacillus niacini]|uniref:TetR/AcrR family transcriptional regulator n=1 Tax=Neobacillus niacini TaxID=86668 RepID=UPI0021CB0F6D|nr:TetR/AcrR family transcriptional regulator [Neobacillus niacini]MCM3763379.1 TetR/AcrR family transcriptional regulator [Neobacillus niacini]
MTEKIADKRVARTKRVIRDALTQLMEEKGFEGITVRDLTEKAQINRGTFYLHYRDKYDLLEQSEEEILKGIAAITENIDPVDAMAYTSNDEPFPIILKLFEFFQEHAEFLKVILGANGNASFQVKLKSFIKKIFYSKLVTKLNKEGIQVPVEILLAYLSSAHLGVVQHWLETGMEKSPREITLILTKMTLLGPGYVAGLKPPIEK